MQIRIMSEGLACSTLLMGHLPTRSSTPTLEDFKNKIKKHIPTPNDKVLGSTGLRGFHKIKSFSYITVSTNGSQRGIHTFLRKLGFVSNESVKNSKNGTTVRFWVCPIPTFITNVYGEPDV